MDDAFRSLFDFDDDILHLNNAGVAPMCRAAVDAMISAAKMQATSGTLGVTPLIQAFDGARESFARLVGADADDVSFMPTCSAAISQVALGFPFKVDDEVVVVDQEYPSNAYPWHEAARRSGARVVVVPSTESMHIDHAAMERAITTKTKIVAVSFVQFQNGALADLARLSRAAHRVGAWLCVDAIQGLGVVPFDMRALGVDAVAGGTHKWLCGPLGQGFLVLAPGKREVLAPSVVGAITFGTTEEPVDENKRARDDARRFEPGAPPVFAVAAALAAVDDVLRVGVAAIHRGALAASDLIVDEARARGHRLLAPSNDDVRSPIVTMVIPHLDPVAVHRALSKRRVAVAARAGGIRVSPHAFTSRDDVDRFFAALDDACAEIKATS